jgi:acetyl esterase/lipase
MPVKDSIKDAPFFDFLEAARGESLRPKGPDHLVMMRGTGMRAIGVFLLAVLVLPVACSSIGHDAHLERSFYAVPVRLPPGRPGELIRMTPVPSPRGSQAWVILYHSRSADGRDIAVSGTLVAPDAPPPAAGYPVVSWAHGTTGLADGCAPSRSAFSGSLVDDGIAGTLMRLGFVVVATDYEGLGVRGPHPYLVGKSEGRSVLDAARAARTVPGLRVSNRIGLFGYSQGGHAVLWAAQLARTYAPELDVTGSVAAAPVGDLVKIAKHWASAEGQEPYLLSALDSWSTLYGLPLEPVLTPRGEEARNQVRHRCTGELDWEAFGSGLFRRRSPAWRSWLDLARANTPGLSPTQGPVLVQHGDDDDLIPIESSEAVVHALCAHGAQAELRVYWGADHDVLGPGLADAISWIVDSFRGTPRIGSCDG